MSLFDRISNFAEAAYTIDVQLKHQDEAIQETRGQVNALAAVVSELRERVTRLEAQRDADRAQLAAQLEVFKTVIERNENRSRALPDGE